MSEKLQRLAQIVAGLVLAAGLGAPSAQAEELRATDAQHFIAGKHFTYNCFDGTNGNGRIYADGSVAGYIQVGGSGARRYVVLPANTLRVRGDQYCASLRGLPFSPCFNVNRTSQVSFRGSVSGFGFAYCDFQRRSPRADVIARPALRLHRQTANAGE
jgi:hypothetical protein